MATLNLTPSRRAMLACIAIAPLAPASAAQHPDASLIALCGEFAGLEARLNVLDPDSAPYRAAHEAQEALLDRITALPPAKTLDGMRAVASALRAYASDLFEIDEEGAWDERLLSTLLRSLTTTQEI